MVVDGIEAVIGVTRHETFGLTLTVGSGGVLVELVRDTALSVLPIDHRAARELVERTRLATLIGGYRGGPKGDLDAFVDAVARIGAIATAYADRLTALELNPIVILPEGKGVRVLDALLIPRSGQA